MKKIFSFCLIALTMMLAFTSCLESDGELAVKYYPYAMLRSVSIGNIDSKYIIKASDGSDSTIIKTVKGENYPFAIDQDKCEAYNVDSLPVGTDITKVATDINCDGIAYLYVDSLQKYELFVESDSFDFTNPMRILVSATDGSYSREYKISLNVHTLDPNQLYWNKMAVNPAASSASVRMLAKDETLYLFGCDAEGNVTLSTAATSAAAAWESKSVSGLPLSPTMNSLVQYAGNFYIVSDGKIYASADGEVWENVACEANVTTLFAASDKDNVVWAVANDSLAYASNVADGFTAVQPVAANFPLNDLSSIIAPLRTNMNINRYTLIGRVSQGAQPQVWSRLSSERKWVNYSPSSYNTKLCPSLESLVVFPYDDKLYAIGGKGTAAGAEVGALNAIYISRDNGLTWEASGENGPSLPAELVGVDAPFTAFVDGDGNIWLAVCGENGAIWRGRMNKLDI